jgi:hypothetical protein
MADQGLSIYDLTPVQPTKPKPAKSKGLSVASLVKPVEPPAPSTSFASHVAKTIKTAAYAAADDPPEAVFGAADSLIKGGISMINLAASGVAALAKTMVKPGKDVDSTVNSFVENQKQVETALQGVNDAPATRQEEAMLEVLNLIPEGTQAIGDTVYEKTGSALAATGALSLATLLTLSPDIAARTMGKVGEIGKGKTPPSKVSAAFDELAAKHPKAAASLTNHINQVDPATAKKLHARIQKYIDASDKELSIIGRNAAEATIKELEGNYDEAIKSGVERVMPTAANLKGHLQQGSSAAEAYLARAHEETVSKAGMLRRMAPDVATKSGPPDVRKSLSATEDATKAFNIRAREEAIAKQRMMLTVGMTPERVSSTIRTAAKEGVEAIQEANYTIGEEPVNMSLTKEQRAAERERVAALRDRGEGVKSKFTPEPVPKRAAEHEGEVARRTAQQEQDEPGNPDIIYFNNGIPITREHITAAFNFTSKLASKIPGVDIAKAKMERLYQGYIETFNPEAKGPAARTAGAAIASNFFEQAHREHVTWQQGKERRVYWQKMGPEASMNFINKFEKGSRLDNPIQEKARVAYKNWADQIYAQDMRTGFTYDPVDHYMPHLFVDGDGVLRFMQKRFGNKWADPRFIKERGYDLYQEAIDAGFTPKYTNPEEIMQARQQASDIAALRTDLLADLERKGVAVRAAKGADRPPAGFSPNSRRSPTGQRYWVREEADALMHNAFDSKSLWADRGLKGEAFRGYMELKNKIVPIKLMASLFHPMHVIHIDAAAELTRSSKLALGNPSLAHTRDFMLSMATATPFTPGSLYRSLWDNPKTGYPVLRVFQGKRDFATLSDSDKAAYKDLAEGGLVPTRPREETSSSMQRMLDSWHKGEIGKATFHLPFAVLSSLSHPIYNVWIPTLKIASYLKDVKVARELNPDWKPAQRQEAFRQIARKVEARYGEMNYNSLFMNKVAKDIGVATNLSLGWNIGLLDQYVGGALDLGQATMKGSYKENIASGRLDRPVFAAYYIGSALMVGGLMHYYFTGKTPQTLIDYTHPESGENDQYGKPVRLNTMFYTREFEGLYKHMQQEGTVQGLSDFVYNKGSGVMEMAKSALTGVDSLGQEIRDPNAPAYKQLEQTLWSEFLDLDPISREAIAKSTGSPVKSVGLSVLGFTPAGKYISETVLEGQIANAYNKYVRPKEKPFEAVQMSKDVKDLREAYNKGDPKYDVKLDGMIAKYGMDEKDIHRMEKMFNSPKEQNFDPSIYMFQHLPWEIQKPMLDKMKKEERENYLPHISKQKRHKYEAAEDAA